MRLVVTVLVAALCVAFSSPPAIAQKIVFGQGFSVGEDQKLVFEAAKKVMEKQYPEAESLYSRAISINSSNLEAYLQRGVVRREMGNQNGAISDGRMVVKMADAMIKTNPGSAGLYYQRGMGYRLARDFVSARQDIARAIQMNNKKAAWRNDLKAVELEEKAAQ